MEIFKKKIANKDIMNHERNTSNDASYRSKKRDDTSILKSQLRTSNSEIRPSYKNRINQNLIERVNEKRNEFSNLAPIILANRNSEKNDEEINDVQIDIKCDNNYNRYRNDKLGNNKLKLANGNHKLSNSYDLMHFNCRNVVA